MYILRIVKLKRQMLGWIVAVCLAFVPVWHFTTRVYRAEVPVEDIRAWRRPGVRNILQVSHRNSLRVKGSGLEAKRTSGRLCLARAQSVCAFWIWYWDTGQSHLSVLSCWKANGRSFKDSVWVWSFGRAHEQGSAQVAWTNLVWYLQR